MKLYSVFILVASATANSMIEEANGTVDEDLSSGYGIQIASIIWARSHRSLSTTVRADCILAMRCLTRHVRVASSLLG